MSRSSARKALLSALQLTFQTMILAFELYMDTSRRRKISFFVYIGLSAPFVTVFFSFPFVPPLPCHFPVPVDPSVDVRKTMAHYLSLWCLTKYRQWVPVMPEYLKNPLFLAVYLCLAVASCIGVENRSIQTRQIFYSHMTWRYVFLYIAGLFILFSFSFFKFLFPYTETHTVWVQYCMSRFII